MQENLKAFKSQEEIELGIISKNADGSDSEIHTVRVSSRTEQLSTNVSGSFGNDWKIKLKARRKPIRLLITRSKWSSIGFSTANQRSKDDDDDNNDDKDDENEDQETGDSGIDVLVMIFFQIPLVNPEKTMVVPKAK